MRIGGRSKTGKTAMRRTQDMAKAFELRTRGWTQRRIAAELGCSLAKVNDLLQVGVKQHPAENVEMYRAVALAALDDSEARQHEIIDAHMAQARGGDIGAAGVIYDAESTLDKVRARRHKVLGLDAPTRTEHTGASGGPIAVVDYKDLTDMTDEQLDEARSAVERAAPDDAGAATTAPDRPREGT